MTATILEMPPAIVQSPKYPHIRVQLVGKDSNAFNILALCQRAATKAGLSREEINQFFEEAKAGDYDHLLRTCMKWFDVD